MECFHAHLYFTEETRDSAMRIREQLRTMTAFTVELQPVRDAPMGPHPSMMFNSHIRPEDLGATLLWFMHNHGPHSVLLHPETGDALADHTEHAMWLGPPQPLNLDGL